MKTQISKLITIFQYRIIKGYVLKYFNIQSFFKSLNWNNKKNYYIELKPFKFKLIKNIIYVAIIKKVYIFVFKVKYP